jgi:hypothetical protein
LVPQTLHISKRLKSRATSSNRECHRILWARKTHGTMKHETADRSSKPADGSQGKRRDDSEE